MTTAVDVLTVSAPSKADAPDVARRQWEPMFRMVRVLSVTLVPGCDSGPGRLSRWKVTADVEVRR